MGFKPMDSEVVAGTPKIGPNFNALNGQLQTNNKDQTGKLLMQIIEAENSRC